MADTTITASEVSALDAAIGGLAAAGVYYSPNPGQDHGVLQAYANAADEALTAALENLAKLRSGTLKPKPQTQYEFLNFLGLFTPQEQASIVSSADPRIRVFCLMAAGAAYVDLTDPRVISGVQLLESLALIATGRAATVLAGQTPPNS